MYPKLILTAVLVDFDNIIRLGQRLTKFIENWTNWIEDGGFAPPHHRRKLVYKKVYWNSHNDGHRVPFVRAGYQTAVCIGRRKEKASSADFEITIDAMELAHTFKRLDEILILSFDTDFLPVLHRMQEKGLRTGAMVNADARTAIYRDRVDAVISDAQLRSACGYVRPPPRLFMPRTPPPLYTAPPAPLAAPRPPQLEQSLGPTPQRGEDLSGYDMEAAAARILAAGAQAPGMPLSKRRVVELLRGVPGFQVTPPAPYFGLGSYPALSAFFAECVPGLSIETFAPGGYFALVYRPPEFDGEQANAAPPVAKQQPPEPAADENPDGNSNKENGDAHASEAAPDDDN